MQGTAQAFDTLEAAHPESGMIETTLYGLIEAIGDEVQQGEELLVSETVLHLFRAGRAKFLRRRLWSRDD
jgi:hypothetical protein